MEDKQKSLKKPLAIFGSILLAVALAAILLAVFGKDSDSVTGNLHSKHIAVLYIEGTIGEDSDTYDHEYVIDSIDEMIDNDKNKGIMLFVNTPGGGVYESDEVYLKLEEYKELTGRPVYSYMASQATSGGYYISAAADKIIANRNCWTGSIGVTIGTIYDVSGLLEKYGVRTSTITSGDNKSMGSAVEPMTKEQKEILQALVDEAYEQFVAIVCKGRGLDDRYVRKLADGRIYTAKQAYENGLIDDVTDTYDDALDLMMSECKLEECEIEEYRYEPDYGLLEGFVQSIEKSSDDAAGESELEVLSEMMSKNGKIELQYMCEVVK